MQSCFPAFFKFRNGDIGLLHSIGASIEKVRDLLDRDDLEEIQLFENGIVLNSQKVQKFTENVIKHYETTNRIQPAIHIQSQDYIAPYGVAICYKLPNNEPVIIIGESGVGNELVETLDSCDNSVDLVKHYEFENVTKKFNPISTKAHRFFTHEKDNRSDTGRMPKATNTDLI